jgi:endonuclease G
MQGTPKAIGFVFKNDSSTQPMRNQVKSIDEIEEITGLDFFSALPDSIEDRIEAISEIGKW